MLNTRTWALLAPGESLTQEICDFVRGKVNVMAISDAYRLAPWADALVANDSAWWRKRPDTVEFPGKKFTVNTNISWAKPVATYDTIITRQSNSGLLGMYCARNLGAKRILMLGFDLKGTHFFGEYSKESGLRNTTPARFKTFMYFFERLKHEMLAKEGIEVFNCNLDSALKCFTKMPLEEALALPPR